MKINKTKLYAKALAEIIIEKKPARQNAEPAQKAKPIEAGKAFGAKEPNTDKLVKNFVQFLERNGQMRRAEEILNLAEDFLLVKQGKKKITFETARRLTADNRAKLKEFAKEGDIVKEKINHELIAGMKITINNEKQFDNSMQSKLQKIF